MGSSSGLWRKWGCKSEEILFLVLRSHRKIPRSCLSLFKTSLCPWITREAMLKNQKSVTKESLGYLLFNRYLCRHQFFCFSIRCAIFQLNSWSSTLQKTLSIFYMGRILMSDMSQHSCQKTSWKKVWKTLGTAVDDHGICHVIDWNLKFFSSSQLLWFASLLHPRHVSKLPTCNISEIYAASIEINFVKITNLEQSVESQISGFVLNELLFLSRVTDRIRCKKHKIAVVRKFSQKHTCTVSSSYTFIFPREKCTRKKERNNAPPPFAILTNLSTRYNYFPLAFHPNMCAQKKRTSQSSFWCSQRL